MSQSGCILVCSCKHHRSVCGTGRIGAGIMLSEPTLCGDGGTRSESEEVAVGGGPAGGVGSGVSTTPSTNGRSVP